jgi:hypothetical protein
VGERILKSFNSSILFYFSVYTDGECEGKVLLYLKKAIAEAEG